MNPPLICRAVMAELAQRYARRRAGRTGEAAQRVLFDYEEILTSCDCADGNRRTAAEEQLREAARHEWIALHGHRRDASLVHQIEFLPAGEAAVFAALAAKSPAERRRDWRARFLSAAEYSVPEKWSGMWRPWCASQAESASRGQVRAPFQWENEDDGTELLRVLAGALSWQGESLIRFASCVLCGDSKRLEQLAPRLETALAEITNGTAGTLEAHGILRIPRTVLVHGPLRLDFPEGTFDFGLLRAPAWISEADILRATAVRTTALRCLSVENETTMQELAKQQSSTLLIQTSYPSSAVVALMSRLPADIECWHFGDADPWGFAILHDLRQKTGRTIRPLHMTFRISPSGTLLTRDELRLLTRLLADPGMTGVHHELAAMQLAGHKGAYEQESLGFPDRQWPFYELR